MPKVLSWPGGTLSYNISAGTVGPFWIVGTLSSSLNIWSPSIAIFDGERNVLISCSSLTTALAIRRILGRPLIIVVSKISNIGPSVGSIKSITKEVANTLLCSGPSGNSIESKGATADTTREVGPRGEQS